jgi:hypothetical protein
VGAASRKKLSHNLEEIVGLSGLWLNPRMPRCMARSDGRNVACLHINDDMVREE